MNLEPKELTELLEAARGEGVALAEQAIQLATNSNGYAGTEVARIKELETAAARWQNMYVESQAEVKRLGGFNERLRKNASNTSPEIDSLIEQRDELQTDINIVIVERDQLRKNARNLASRNSELLGDEAGALATIGNLKTLFGDSCRELIEAARDQSLNYRTDAWVELATATLKKLKDIKDA